VVKFTFTFYRIILIAWKFRTAISERRSEKHLELISSNIRKNNMCLFFFFSFLQKHALMVNGIWIR